MDTWKAGTTELCMQVTVFFFFFWFPPLNLSILLPLSLKSTLCQSSGSLQRTVPAVSMLRLYLWHPLKKRRKKNTKTKKGQKGLGLAPVVCTDWLWCHAKFDVWSAPFSSSKRHHLTSKTVLRLLCELQECLCVFSFFFFFSYLPARQCNMTKM